MFNNYKLERNCPKLFIIGSIRSGTTIIYQYLTSYYNFAFFPNMARKYPKHPILAALYVKYFEKLIPTFESDYGDINGNASPSDGWEIFHRWFSYYYNPYKTKLNKLKKLKRIIWSLEELYKAPFINKNNSNSLRIIELSYLFEKTLFINVKRNIYDTIFSVQKGRAKKNIKKNEFWGVAPEKELIKMNFESTLSMDVYQYLFVNEYVKQVLANYLDHNNYIDIEYNTFANNLELINEWIEKTYHLNEVTIKPRNLKINYNEYINFHSYSNEIDDNLKKEVDKYVYKYSEIIIEKVNSIVDEQIEIINENKKEFY